MFMSHDHYCSATGQFMLVYMVMQKWIFFSSAYPFFLIKLRFNYLSHLLYSSVKLFFAHPSYQAGVRAQSDSVEVLGLESSHTEA